VAVELGDGAERADLFDVTPGVATKWTLPVESGALTPCSRPMALRPRVGV
jgi:hypothetical protein